MDTTAKPWFRPKVFGIGVGPPVAWQGWLVTAGYVAGLCVALALLQGMARQIAVLVLSAVFLIIARGRTTEPMRWRWGRR